MIICSCHGISDREYLEMLAKKAKSPALEARACEAGTCCGGCRPTLEALQQEIGGATPAGTAPHKVEAPRPQVD